MKLNKFFSLFLMAVITVLSLSLASCGSDDADDTPAPVITITEANLEEDEGNDVICTQADIVAQGRTRTIVINIYDSTGKTLKHTFGVTDSKYIDKLNIDGFHVHVAVTGKNVAEGDLLKLTVADANGRSTTAQQTITAEEEDEDEHHHDHE